MCSDRQDGPEPESQTALILTPLISISTNSSGTSISLMMSASSDSVNKSTFSRTGLLISGVVSELYNNFEILIGFFSKCRLLLDLLPNRLAEKAALLHRCFVCNNARSVQFHCTFCILHLVLDMAFFYALHHASHTYCISV